MPDLKDLNNKTDYPDMVHWFSPSVLLKTVRKVILSTIFGAYADRRLVHAALDSPIDNADLESRYGGISGFYGDKDAIWLDYIADLGDGFDSTYTVAYLAGQKELNIAGTHLPRAHCLIMGGDEVYPDASREDYQRRTKRPYQYAFPATKASGADHPRLYLLPGNHDWYDGLTLFLANFCRGRDTALGSWNATQNRSYFAVHLGHNWWVWGYDSQLGEDIDKPQADYFASIARSMPEGAKVILCASVPTWLRASLDAANAEEAKNFYRGLHYIANLAKNEAKRAIIPLVLAGDLHHYSRYTAPDVGTNFITAGGGGAFLHPTHHLKSGFLFRWILSDHSLQVAHDEKTNEPAIYPSQKESRRLALGNWKFILKNPDFCATLGTLYAAVGFLILAWRGYRPLPEIIAAAHPICAQIAHIAATPAFLLAAVLICGATIQDCDLKATGLKIAVGTLHGLLHLGVMIIATATLSLTLSPLLAVAWGEVWYPASFILAMLVAGFLGGLIWGFYLLIASWGWAAHANDAFSAMRLNCFRNFLRMKIEADQVTIYPIGVRQTPARSEWAFNPSAKPDDQNQPVVIPTTDLNPHFIETPFVVRASDVKPLI